MNNRRKAIKKLCLKLIKNDNARKLMHDENNMTWIKGQIGIVQFKIVNDETEWGKRIYEILRW
ncbi:hypothetical protein [Veillonella sp.]|uniref:hypothetical protein n=1 Tax=Veillonella sp. TaxID=1926307 RepID=UPI0025FBEE79|nr:hypothetical protein [Veillonella sp.]